MSAYLAVQHADGRFRIRPWGDKHFEPGTEFTFPDGSLHKITKDGYLNIPASVGRQWGMRNKGKKYIAVRFASSPGHKDYAVQFGTPQEKHRKYLPRQHTGSPVDTKPYKHDYWDTEPEEYTEFNWSP